MTDAKDLDRAYNDGYYDAERDYSGDYDSGYDDGYEEATKEHDQRELIEDLYYDCLEGRDIKPYLNILFHKVLNKRLTIIDP